MFAGPTVKSAADLKGGTVGISSTGSETDATTTLALRSLGLKREDVTIKEIGRPTRRTTANTPLISDIGELTGRGFATAESGSTIQFMTR